MSPEAPLVYVPEGELAAAPGEFSEAELRALEEVNRRAAGAGSMEELLRLVLDATGGVSPSDRLSVAFLEPGERIVCYRTVASYEPLLLAPGYSEGLAGSSLAEVLASGRPRIITDLERYAHEHPESRSTKLVLGEGIRSSMTCPLVVEGRRVGLFWRSSRRAGAYDAHQVRLHLAVAERLGQAAEKAWRIEQLAAAAHAYAEMLGFVSHELKSPVASMLTDLKLVLDGYLGEVEPRQREKLAGAVRKGERLLALVREYLDLARVDGAELKARFRKGVDFLAEVVRPAIELVRPQLAERRQELVEELPAGLPALECDPELIGAAALNYLANAVKYGAEGGRVRVAASAAEGRMRFSVWNSGPGFKAEERGRLFRRFSRLEDPELRRRGGTGVGLYTVARALELHGGRVGADSRHGEWAEFWFELPLARPSEEKP